jgi:hypothetical protein
MATFRRNMLRPSSILKMEATCCFETSVSVYETTRCHDEKSTILAIAAIQISEQFWRRNSTRSWQSKDLDMQMLLLWSLTVAFDVWSKKWPGVVYFTVLSICILCNIRTLLCHLPGALCPRTLGFEHAMIAIISIINLVSWISFSSRKIWQMLNSSIGFVKCLHDVCWRSKA